MSKDRSVYIKHIYDCICRIEEYTSAGREEFFSDHKTQDAVIRNLEVIGQAIKDFGVEDLIVNFKDIPWNEISGMRNILAHQYLGVSIKTTWAVIEKDLQPLKVAIKDILKLLG
ncbi:MAG: DUF86 domain-containing protein [Woeseiaceae bacterium]